MRFLKPSFDTMGICSVLIIIEARQEEKLNETPNKRKYADRRNSIESIIHKSISKRTKRKRDGEHVGIIYRPFSNIVGDMFSLLMIPEFSSSI